MLIRLDHTSVALLRRPVVASPVLPLQSPYRWHTPRAEAPGILGLKRGMHSHASVLHTRSSPRPESHRGECVDADQPRTNPDGNLRLLLIIHFDQISDNFISLKIHRSLLKGDKCFFFSHMVSFIV